MTTTLTCAQRYGGTCAQPVSQTAHRTGVGCRFHGTGGNGSAPIPLPAFVGHGSNGVSAALQMSENRCAECGDPLPAGRPNFVTAAGSPARVCDTCWYASPETCCEVCDRLAEGLVENPNGVLECAACRPRSRKDFPGPTVIWEPWRPTRAELVARAMDDYVDRLRDELEKAIEVQGETSDDRLVRLAARALADATDTSLAELVRDFSPEVDNPDRLRTENDEWYRRILCDALDIRLD